MKLVEKGQNLWKVIRQVTKDDLKFNDFVTSRVDYQYGIVRSGVMAHMTYDWPEALQVDYRLDNERTFSKMAFYEKVKYNGLRTEEAKQTKFSDFVDQAEHHLQMKREELIQQILDDVNESIQNAVKRANEKITEQMTRTFVNASNWDFSDDDNPDDLAKEEELKNQIEALQTQLMEHREKMRVDRVQFAKKYVLEELDESELRDKLVEELEKPTALKKLNRRLFR